jgi:hypothetical protein
MTSHNQRKSSLVSSTGCSFQFGRTSILLPRPQHLAAFHPARYLGLGRIARHVDQRLVAAGVVVARTLSGRGLKHFILRVSKRCWD